jgi:hypothetical protein
MRGARRVGEWSGVGTGGEEGWGAEGTVGEPGWGSEEG